MELSITILGYSAITIWLCSRISQMKQMYKTKKVEDVNFYFLFFDLIGQILYVIYSILLNDIVIIISSGLPIFFNIMVLWLWCKYKKNVVTDISNTQLTIQNGDLLA